MCEQTLAGSCRMTGSLAGCSGMTGGGAQERGDMCGQRLSHVAAWRKLAQHCKAMTPQ